MVYSTSRCPKCGEIIKQQKNPSYEIGNPFEHCRHCGAIYLNNYKEEWITKSPLQRFFFFIQFPVWARAFLIPVILIVVIKALGIDMSIDGMKILWAIGADVWLIGGYFVHKIANQPRIRESIERTKNPEYVRELRDAGYSIYPIDKNSAPDKSPSKKENQTIIILLIAIFVALTAVIAVISLNHDNGIDTSNNRPTTVNNVTIRMITLTDEYTAEYILAKWENGAATEQSLIQIMDEHAPEQGGGKRHIVERGDYVTEIEDWCFSTKREIGDYTIIENDYGYTICYISGFNE